MRILIVEDEKIAARHLLQLLKKIHFDFEEAIHLRSVSELIAWLSKNKQPDLIFLDIHLNDGTSLEVFDIIKVTAPVIFITAYDKYVIESFKANSINYILKPVEETVLRDTVAKFYKVRDYYGSFNPQPATIAATQTKERILVRKGTSNTSLPVTDIAFFYSEMKITFAVDFRDNKYYSDYKLSDLEQMLDKKLFFRANRQVLVNINAIREFRSIEFSKIELHLKQNSYIREAVIISQFTAPDFKKWIANL
jgi:DNA-binding LytR/AlgR family response regulator